MIKRFKDLETNYSLSKAAIIVGFFTLLSRLVGLARDRLFASRFGAGDVLDVYYASFRIPDFVFNLLVLGTLSVAFIPVFTEWLIKDRARALRIANTILNFSIILMGSLCLVLLFFVHPLTRLLVPGFSGEKFQSTVMLTRIFLLSPIIFTVSNLFGSMLNAQKRFFMVSLAPILYNFGIIGGLLFLYPRFGLKGLGIGVLVGAGMHLVAQLIESIRLGFYWLPVLDLHDEAIKKIGKLFVPRIFGLDTSQISLLIGSVIGSLLTSGSITVLNLANNLQAVPLGIFAISLAIAAFPSLSESYAKKDDRQFTETLLSSIIQTLFFIIPISILILLLRAYIVRLAYGTGNFNWNDTILTFSTLGILTVSLFSQSLLPLFARAFYARQNTKTPVLVGLVCMAFNVALSYIFATKGFSWQITALHVDIRIRGVLGIALGFTVASILNTLILFVLLRHQLVKSLKQDFVEKLKFDLKLSRAISKIVIASIAMGIIGYLMIYLIAPLVNTHTGLGILIQSGIAALAAAVTFVTVSVWLKIPQAQTLLKIPRRIFSLHPASNANKS